MSEPEITVTYGEASDKQQVIIKELRIDGWLVFYRQPNTSWWFLLMPSPSNLSTAILPYPLFIDAETAIAEARKQFEVGCELKMVRITL
ncbi:MAG TPA: hypothetical protein DCF63_09860 [Planctomycetaceae bacterium]|nr:hypothetical protein [Planctomycetaceae bacterium]